MNVHQVQLHKGQVECGQRSEVETDDIKKSSEMAFRLGCGKDFVPEFGSNISVDENRC